MKNLFSAIILPPVNKASKQIICTMTAMLSLFLTAHAQIINGSFENGFTGWNTTAGDFIIGAVGGPPVATSGGNSAVIGGGNISGSILSQTIPTFASGLSYLLRYDSLASVPNLPSPQTASWTVVIVADAQTIFSQNFSQQSIGFPNGSIGFINRQINFSVPVNTQNITIRFVDNTLSGGVDPAFDTVSISAAPEPSSVVLMSMAAIVAIGAMRVRKH